MFELPTLGNLILSTIVFFVSAWYIHRWLDNHDIPAGMTRKMLVFVLASLVSWAAGNLEETLQGKPEAPHQTAQTVLSMPQ